MLMKPKPARAPRSWQSQKWATLHNVAKSRARLLADMGGRCTHRGCTERREAQLEFHHPNGRDWDPAAHNRWVRIAQYRRDWDAGQLVVLCRRHNTIHGNRHRR